MKSIRISTVGELIVSLAFISIAVDVSGAEGRIIEEFFYSKALEGNIIGDSPQVWYFCLSSTKLREVK